MRTLFFVIIVLPLLGLGTFSALGGDHRHVAGDQLWVKECFILQAPNTRMWNHRHLKTAGAWNIPGGNMICVEGVDREGARPWFKVLVIKPATLDRSQHIPGWIDSQQMMEHGVILAY